MFQCPGRKEPALSVLNKSNQIQYMGTALLFILLRKMTNCQNPKGDTRPMPCPTWGISGQLSRPQPRRGGWFMDLYLCQIIGTSANVFLIFWAIPAQTACDGFRCIIHILHIYIYIYIMLDTFELKRLRKTWNMETTYINRANTNEEVYRRANIWKRKPHTSTQPSVARKKDQIDGTYCKKT